jgi:transposase
MKSRRGKRRRPHKPARLIPDRGYDSHHARALQGKRGIELSIPRRKNNRVATHHDGRKRRRDRRREIIERTNAWLQNFRLPVVRYAHHVKHVEALVHLACALVALKQVSE